MDVIVIGAGPVGSFAAWRLAQSGLRTLVIEEHAAIGEPAHCTGIVSRRVFERFGLPREAVIRELEGVTFYSPAGHSLTLDLDAPSACVIDRPAFDRRLAGLAQAAGAHYALATRARQVQPRAGRISVEVEGGARRLEARMCIVAGGSRCRLGAGCGLRYPPAYANGAQVEATVADASRTEVYCGPSVAPGSFGWVVPVAQGRARVGLRAFGEVHRRLERFMRHPALAGRITAPSAVMGGPIPALPAPKTYAERMLAVGDAAGQVKATTGGGVMFGLMGAEIAAQVAEEACRRDQFGESFLRAYQVRWRRAIAREQRLGMLARRLAGLLGDDDVDDLVRRAGRNALRLARGADFDHHARPLLAVLRTPALWAVLKGALG